MNGPSSSAVPERSSRPWGTLAVALLAWGAWANQLRVEWSVNPQYHYGWCVPLLALYLFWKRWSNRPEPPASGAGAGPLLFLFLIAFTLLPLRLVEEANPDWRLITWGLSGVTLALSFLGLWLIGGIRWCRHFLVPIAFLLLAVPWPTQLEQGLVQSLRHSISAATAEIMNWMGIAARLRGNVIELTENAVGVSEACSGLRSFQTTLMVSILVGELQLLSVAKRAALLLAGTAWALGLNLVRTCFLTWICARSGPGPEAQWHDPAGYVQLGLAVAGVWLVGFLWSRPRPASSLPPTTLDPGLPPLTSPRFLSIGLSGVLAGWILFVEVSTDLWYRAHEQHTTTAWAWKVVWPEREPGFQNEPLPDPVRSLLRCDEGKSARWRRLDGSEWTLFSLKWRPGRMAAQLATGHTPDVCLPSSGFKMVSELGFVSVRIGPLEMPFNTYVFSGNGQPCYVFFCLMDDRSTFSTRAATQAAQSYLAGLEPENRLRAVWLGRRHSGQQVLEVAMTGYADREQAQRALTTTLSTLIRISRKAG